MAYWTTDCAYGIGEDEVAQRLEELDEKQTGGNRVYYLAIPPSVFPVVVEALGKRRSTSGWTRLIVEKPFGHDLASARELNTVVQKHFEEDEVFQNHLLQLLALTAMEPPIDFTSESVRNEKVKVLRSLHTPGPKSVVRGQYGRGFIEGEEVVAYREEEDVAPDSMTDTYVAAKLYADNWRWADTPFYVRMGKRLARRETTMTIRTVHMDFLYGGAFRTGMPEAYERLILDTMRGDATLFTRTDEVEEQWALVDAIVAPWARDRPAFPNYAAGSWGPHSADELIQRDGRSWRRH